MAMCSFHKKVKGQVQDMKTVRGRGSPFTFAVLSLAHMKLENTKFITRLIQRSCGKYKDSVMEKLAPGIGIDSQNSIFSLHVTFYTISALALEYVL